MIGAAIIVFRETLEAALIIGILAAATSGLAGRNRWLGGGIATGLAGAVVVAIFTGQLAELAEGTGQDIFNAAVLGVAVLMLAWHNIWMARNGAELARSAKSLGRDVRDGNRDLAALAVVIALAVLREGSETALFLYGLAASNQSGLASTAGGGIIGLMAGGLAGFGLYAGFVRIPTRWFFSATSGLILLMAASMAAQMARYLAQSDVLPSMGAAFWDTSTILSNQNPVGAMLHSIMGYDATPSGIQVLFYFSALALILFGMRLARPPLKNSHQ
jgi:high-affinity iron transporter